jgi:OTT_1508-like deaminase
MNLDAYIDLCYDMRSLEMSHIKTHSVTVGDDFSRLAHYVYRLGATRSAANMVVDAMITVPSLRQISLIRPVSTPETVEKMVDSSCMSPHEVLYGILADSASHNPLQVEHVFNRLLQLDPPVARPIYTKMASRQRILTRVHAELQIADTFSRSREMEFDDNDKYIGCSKPACYFCYNWLSTHRHRYAQPATHYKIILGCRGPDNNLNETGAAVLIEMYSKISRQIGQDIFEFLQQNAQPRLQYMSTEASSRAPSQI